MKFYRSIAQSKRQLGGQKLFSKNAFLLSRQQAVYDAQIAAENATPSTNSCGDTPEGEVQSTIDTPSELPTTGQRDVGHSDGEDSQVIILPPKTPPATLPPLPRFWFFLYPRATPPLPTSFP